MDYSYFALIPIILMFILVIYCLNRVYDRLFQKRKNILSEQLIENQ